MKKLAILTLALGLTACSKVNMENYNKIKVGMDKAEVEQILGSADKCEEKTLHTACIWGGEDKHIKITLVSDKVTIYSKKGIE